MTKDKSSNTQAKEKEFDFRLGEWDLTWGDDGHGSNRVSSILDGRGFRKNLMEHHPFP